MEKTTFRIILKTDSEIIGRISTSCIRIYNGNGNKYPVLSKYGALTSNDILVYPPDRHHGMPGFPSHGQTNPRNIIIADPPLFTVIDVIVNDTVKINQVEPPPWTVEVKYPILKFPSNNSNNKNYHEYGVIDSRPVIYGYIKYDKIERFCSKYTFGSFKHGVTSKEIELGNNDEHLNQLNDDIKKKITEQIGILVERSNIEHIMIEKCI